MKNIFRILILVLSVAAIAQTFADVRTTEDQEIHREVEGEGNPGV